MKIPLYKTYIDEEEKRLVNNVIERKSYWTNGPENEELEKLLCKKVGSKYALSFSNGTTALHAMMLAYEIGPGDEVIVPSFTFVATANSVLFTGAKPVFADIEKQTYALDLEDVKNRITKKTKAIMPIHYGGSPALRIKELKELADENDLILLEDAAESLGAKIDNKMVGTFGKAGMYSLCGNKVITTGEGGLVVTDEKKIYEKLKLIRSHGRDETENYFESTKRMDYISLGYNFRMPTIIAALAIAQLKKLDKIVEMRRKIAKRFNEEFLELQLELPYENEKIFNVYQMYSILLKDHRNREKLKDYLDKKEITTKIYFDLIHKTHFYKNILKYDLNLPNSEDISNRILTIPIYPGMKNEEIEHICKNVKKYFE